MAGSQAAADELRFTQSDAIPPRELTEFPPQSRVLMPPQLQACPGIPGRAGAPPGWSWPLQPLEA